jgi:hypothetical protein
MKMRPNDTSEDVGHATTSAEGTNDVDNVSESTASIQSIRRNMKKYSESAFDIHSQSHEILEDLVGKQHEIAVVAG